MTKRKYVLSLLLFIQRTQQGTRTPPRPVIIKHHNVDIVCRWPPSKRNEIEAYRGVEIRITGRRKLVGKSHLSDQRGVAATAVLDRSIIVNNDARRVVAVYATTPLRRYQTKLRLFVSLRLVVIYYRIRNRWHVRLNLRLRGNYPAGADRKSL